MEASSKSMILHTFLECERFHHLLSIVGVAESGVIVKYKLLRVLF